jgi:hypothetical protein
MGPVKLLRSLNSFQIFKTEIKNQKPIKVDDLFKVYPMIPLSGRSNLVPDSTFNMEDMYSTKIPSCIK